MDVGIGRRESSGVGVWGGRGGGGGGSLRQPTIAVDRLPGSVALLLFDDENK